MIPDVEIGVVLMHFVRSAEFPLVQFAFGAAFVAILAIGRVRFHVVAHPAGSVELSLYLVETVQGTDCG